MLLLLACTAPAPATPDTIVREEHAGAVCPDPVTPVTTPPTTVVLITIDSVNRDFLGYYEDTWDTTPNIDRLFAEGVVLENVLVTRGLSAPSLLSILTGAYPRTHGVRLNEDALPSGAAPTLVARFGEAGWRTLVYTTNVCQIVSGDAADDYLCLDNPTRPDLDQADADRLVTNAFESAIASAGDTPVFAWIHLMDPHDPFDVREPWYSTFHPDTYTGPLLDPSPADIESYTMGEQGMTEADRAHLDAMYASQLAGADAQVGRILTALDAAGRSDAIVAFGVDHGEELARRTTYFYHGCSVYDLVTGASYAIRAPGRIPAGEVLSGWVSATDLAPTLAELAGLGWTGGDGASLVEKIEACVEPNAAVYFERGELAAGVIDQGHQFIVDPRLGDRQCNYQGSAYDYPGELRAFYDLDGDPDQTENLYPGGEAYEAELCDWVLSSPWTSDGSDESNPLVGVCGRSGG